MTLDQNVNDVKARQDHPRNDGPGKELAHRQARLVAHDDQHHAGRDEDAQGSPGADGPDAQGFVVAVLHHHRQGQISHGGHRGPDDPRAGPEEQGDENDRQGHSALERSHEVPENVEELLGDLRPVQKLGHEDEKRDGHHHVVAHHRVDPVDEEVEALGPPADVAEDHRQPAEDKGQGMPHEDSGQQPGEHQERQDLGGKVKHRHP